MHIRERTIGNATVLDITGHMTMGRDAEEFRDSIDSLVARAHNRIVINLGGVSYVDSAGLGELLAARTTVSTNGGQIRLVNLTQQIDELLIITKLSTVFEISSNENEALLGFD
jgi:anti-sigma B factor antagonist